MVSVTQHIRKLTQSRKARKARGLTLIELVVVIAVLAILAGFIVPRLGFVRNLAADSGNATTIEDAITQSVFFNTAEGHYPNYEDSLLDSTGANLDTKLSTTLNSSTPANSLLIAQALDATGYKSLLGQFVAVPTLYDFADSAAASSPNADDTVARALTTGGKVAVISSTNITGQAIYRAAFPTAELAVIGTATNSSGQVIGTGTPNYGEFLVAIGYGTNTEINGKTGLEAPVLFDKTAGEYTRPIFLLKVFGTTTGTANPNVPQGSNATTAIAIGYDGTTAGNNLSKYAIDQNR